MFTYRSPWRTLTIVGGALLAVVLAAFVVLWTVAMPVRDLPQPTGPYDVGTISYDLIDHDRPDPYHVPGSAAPAARTIRLQLWYPAEPRAAAPGTTARPEPWMPDGPQHTRAIVRNHGFPFFIWEHTRWMDSNSYRDASPAGPANYPVAIIVHGWEGYRGLHADIAEELASHGYLVAAADHSYGAAATRLEDGTILRSREDVLPERDTTDRFSEYAAELVETFARDIGSIRRHLEFQAARGTSTAEARPSGGGVRLGAATPSEDRATLMELAGRIDLDRLVLVGHSTGGGAVVQYTLERGGQAAPVHGDRGTGDVSAVVGLDAWVEPLGRARLAEAHLTVPTLFLRSQEWIGGINDGYLAPFVARLQEEGAPVELRQMEDITHEQFSTLYMYAPVTRWVGLLGDSDPGEFAEVQREIIREFILDGARRPSR